MLAETLKRYSANDFSKDLIAGLTVGIVALPLAMDATGLNALEDLYERLHRRGKRLVLSGPHTQPLFMMDKAGFLDRLGRENVCAHIDAASERARDILGLPPAAPSDPLRGEKEKLQVAQQELTSALARVNEVLRSPSGNGNGSGMVPQRRSDTVKSEVPR